MVQIALLGGMALKASRIALELVAKRFQLCIRALNVQQKQWDMFEILFHFAISLQDHHLKVFEKRSNGWHYVP